MTFQKAFQWRRSAGSLWAALFAVAATTALGGSVLSGVPNFQKVNDQVYRGGQPTSEGFTSLAELGIKTIVDLREIGEHSQAEEKQLVEANGMRYISAPFRGMSAPSDGQIEQVLGLLGDNSSGPVFVHCRRGADRTGTVIACYRISHDHWQNQDALSEAKRLGMSFIETAMQHYVRNFAPNLADAPVQANGGTP